MKRHEMLERLNKRALTRYGVEITDNMLGDFLESKIVVAPEKHGRIRNWTATEYRQLLEIARLKSFGISDHAEIRWMMWAKGRNVVPMIFAHGDRNFLANLFDGQIAGLFRGISSQYPEVINRDPNGYSARTVLSKLGQLDGCFAAVVEYKRQETFGFYELLKNGTPVPSDLFLPAVCRIGRWAAGALKLPIRIPFGLLLKVVGPHIGRFIAGMARQPDERSSAVARSIQHATPEQFEHARRLLGLSDGFFRRIGLRKVAVSMLHPTWRLPMLALTVHCVRQASRQRRSWLPSMTEIDFAERILLR